MVDPMSAPTLRPAASIARRKAIPSGICEARITTSGRVDDSSLIRAGQCGSERLYEARATTDSPASAAVLAAASATDRAYSSSALTMATRRSPGVAPSRGARTRAAKAAELEPRFVPLAPTRKTSGSPRPVS